MKWINHIDIDYTFFSFDNIGCLPGYIGMNCTSKCPYPTFGIKCQDTCYCSDNQCDVSTGCNTVTTGNIHLNNGVELILSYHQFNWLLISVLLWTSETLNIQRKEHLFKMKI